MPNGTKETANVNDRQRLRAVLAPESKLVDEALKAAVDHKTNLDAYAMALKVSIQGQSWQSRQIPRTPRLKLKVILHLVRHLPQSKNIKYLKLVNQNRNVRKLDALWRRSGDRIQDPITDEVLLKIQDGMHCKKCGY
jgi:hypothetical protein